MKTYIPRHVHAVSDRVLDSPEIKSSLASRVRSVSQDRQPCSQFLVFLTRHWKFISIEIDANFIKVWKDLAYTWKNYITSQLDFFFNPRKACCDLTKMEERNNNIKNKHNLEKFRREIYFVLYTAMQCTGTGHCACVCPWWSQLGTCTLDSSRARAEDGGGQTLPCVSTHNCHTC